jgi:nucleoid-associated protein YgaU
MTGMTGNKFIAILPAMVAGAAALAVAGLYIDWERLFSPSAIEQGPVAAAPEAATSETKPGEAIGALTPPSEPTVVPTFDVVVIEPSGEGVIAGRAAPGWKVSVQSGGVKVGEAKADLQGEWSVVLEKPLPTGDHALSLKITSPDGSRALSSQESIRVAVGTDAGASPAAAAVEVARAAPSPPQQAPVEGPAPTVPAAETPPPSESAETALPTPPEGPRALARSEQNASGLDTQATAPPKPKLVFRTVDYQQSGSGAGTVAITGTSDPGARIVLYYGSERLAEARADGQGFWQIAVATTLSMGQHSFRAERVDAGAGLTQAAFITIERAEPRPEPPAAVAAKPGQAGQVTTANEQPQARGSGIYYVIQRGDTLWAIAKRYLGSGLRYPAIFQDNRAVINNPNLIHPKQEVKVPPQ